MRRVPDSPPRLCTYLLLPFRVVGVVACGAPGPKAKTPSASTDTTTVEAAIEAARKPATS